MNPLSSRLLMILLACLMLLGCTACFVDDTPPVIADVQWTAGGFGTAGSKDCLLEEGVLYVIEPLAGGLSATRIADGSLVWRIDDLFVAAVNPVSVGGCLYVLTAQIEHEGVTVPSLLYLIDKADGSIRARVSLQAPAPLESLDYRMLLHEGDLVLMLRYNLDEVNHDGLWRVPLDSIALQNDTVQELAPEFWKVNEGQSIVAMPLFANGRTYLYYQGRGWKGPWTGEGPMPIGYYPQEVVRVQCLEADGSLVWETHLDHAGMPTVGSHTMFVDQGRLYLADWAGRACLDAGSGEVIWEQAGESAESRLVLQGGRLYSTINLSNKCFDARTGDLVWEHLTPYTEDSNPIVWQDHVYVANADALRVFDLDGTLVAEIEEWGLPGDRMQGYVPILDDTLYLPQTRQLLALKLRTLQ